MEAWKRVEGKTLSGQKSILSETSITVGSVGERVRSDVFSNLVPIYHMSKICGLLPVKFTRNKSGTYSGRLSSSGSLYGKGLMLVLAAAQCWGLSTDICNVWNNDSMSSSDTAAFAATCGDLLTVMCVVSVAILSSPSRWRYVQGVLSNLVTVDEKLGIPTSGNFRKSAVIGMSCTYAYLVTISILDFLHLGFVSSSIDNPFGIKGPIKHSPVYFMYIVINTFLMQYALVFFTLGERFLKFNKAIENLVDNNFNMEYIRKDMGLATQYPRGTIIQSYAYSGNNRCYRTNKFSNSTFSQKEAHNTSAAIDQLINLHGLLCDSIDEINKAYGGVILVGTISCLIHLIISPYFLYTAVHFGYNGSLAALTLQIFWILFHLYTLFLIVQPPYTVTIKGKAAKDLVSHALAGNWNPQVKKQLEIFSIQLLQRPVDFTANGLFFVDRNLLTSIASTVTTYLVILVQFQDASETAGTKNLLEDTTHLLSNSSTLKT